ncbi:RNA polymerase sigma-70 factor, ECF subfamily [Ruminococcus sp. YRD2003]|uniref:RNA polymerase sigma factor n=1 Tax=Ruminococcus sp. YRD2003 TaxID=1452313 RepID=UPI0008D064CA|nr:RNA polymerase sigma-70 factor, ECF subfamily [Ruminococcus flavefaciens]
MEDKKLVRQLSKKNEKALVVLVERYSAYVSTIVRNIVSGVLSESDIEEITADVFIRIWNTSDKLRAETLRSYMAAIARNLAIDRLRREHFTVALDEIELGDGSDIEAETERQMLADELNDSLFEIEPRSRELLLRFYYYYQKIPQIAAEMCMSETACKTALHRARNKLKKKLTERGYGNET